MGYVIAIQFGSIGAAYALATNWASLAVMVAAFVFSCSIVLAADHNIRNRAALIAQANYIALGLDDLFTERPPPRELRTPFEIEPFPAGEPFEWMSWLHIQVTILLIFDTGVFIVKFLLA